MKLLLKFLTVAICNLNHDLWLISLSLKQKALNLNARQFRKFYDFRTVLVIKCYIFLRT